MKQFKKGDIIINIKTKKIEKVYIQIDDNLALYSKWKETNNIPSVKGGSRDNPEFNANNYELLSEYKKRKKQPSIWDLI